MNYQLQQHHLSCLFENSKHNFIQLFCGYEKLTTTFNEVLIKINVLNNKTLSQKLNEKRIYAAI